MKCKIQKTVLFFFVVFASLSSFASEPSKEYKTLRDSALREMTDEFYATFMTKDNDFVLVDLARALPKYKKDNKIQSWKLCMMAQHYANLYNADSAIHYFKKSAASIVPSDDDVLYTRCQTTLCNIYAGTGRPEQALEALEALKKELSEKSDPERHISYYNALAGYYRNISEYEKSAENYFVAIGYISKLSEGIRKNVQLASVYNDLGSVLPDKEQAVIYHKKARELIKGDANYKHMVHTTDVLIVDYKEANSTDEELRNLDSAILFYSSIGAIGDEINGKMARAKAYNLKGEVAKSEAMFLDIMKLSNESGYREGILNTSFYLGNLYYKKGENNKALRYLLQTIDSSSRRLELSLPSLLAVSDIYNQKGNFKQAYNYLNQYNILQDSMQVEENKQAVNKLETIYQSEKKEQEIELLKAQSELDASHQRSQRNQLIGGIIFTTLGSLLFFMLYRNRQKTNVKLQELDATKSRFFENISHEFKTPLTLIKLPVSMALKSNNPLTTKQLNTVHNNASRLQNLVEDLLTLSELDAEQMTVNQTEQNPFKQTRILASQFDSYAESKDITYSYNIEDKNISALYDKNVVEKVLTNLISNAIKYSSSGSNVNVESSLTNSSLVMKVMDNGSGIAPENLEKVFDRFYQVDDKDEGNQGSGIGLALVKKLLELNGGSISLESKIDEGSTFMAMLPLENIKSITGHLEEAAEVTSAATPKKSILEDVHLSTKPQLLIVEDNKELLQFIKELFQDDYDVHTSLNGQDGWDMAQEIVPDFIISDWMMPKMNGIELCELVKTSTVTSHIPFLLLTAKSDVKDKVKGYETGADSYFSKPFNFEELQAQIKNLISQRKTLIQKYSDSGMSANVSSNSHDIKFWDSFKDHLKNNLSNSDLSASSVADAMHMSRMQLHRKLTALTGQTISTIIKNQRMMLAASLLEDPKNRISEICYSVGFNDNSSFSRTFKKEYGMSPTQFREKL